VAELADAEGLNLSGRKAVWVRLPPRAPDADRRHRPAAIHRASKVPFYLGAAFQIRDDLLNLLGDGDEYGKDIGDDIRARASAR
jgi:geranylgeranyl diphosphate synthase, type II